MTENQRRQTTLAAAAEDLGAALGGLVRVEALTEYRASAIIALVAPGDDFDEDAESWLEDTITHGRRPNGPRSAADTVLGRPLRLAEDPRRQRAGEARVRRSGLGFDDAAQAAKQSIDDLETATDAAERARLARTVQDYINALALHAAGE